MNPERTPNWDLEVDKARSKQIVEEMAEIQRAQGCGCFQCQKRAVKLEEKHIEEAWRMQSPPPMDHEEAILVKLALSKLDHE